MRNISKQCRTSTKTNAECIMKNCRCFCHLSDADEIEEELKEIEQIKSKNELDL